MIQKALLVFLTITTIALAALCVIQGRQLRRQAEQQRTAELAYRTEAQAREEAAAQAAQAESRAERLQREVGEFSAVTSGLRSNTVAQQGNLQAMAEKLRAHANDSNTNGDGGMFGKQMGQMLSKMMKDPEMRKMVQAQQRAAVDMMYSGLFKQMRLAPDEKTALTDLLLESQMRQVDNAQGLFGGEANEGVDPAQQRAQFEQERRESDAQIKDLLGDDRFAEFDDYRKNVGERMQLNQLETQLASANIPLQENQMSQLLQVMREEKNRVPAIMPADGQMNPADMKKLMTEEMVEKQSQWLEDYNKRVLDRAATVLSPEQLQKYRDLQEQQTAMQKLGLKMARDMFGKGAAPK